MQTQMLKAASSAETGRVMESRGAVQLSQLQQPLEIQAERSGAVSIDVCEVGSLVEAAPRGPWQHRIRGKGEAEVKLR